MAECIFCNLISGKMKGDIVYEDDQVVAFRDINPQAPVHILVVPRQHIATVNDLTEKEAPVIGKITLVARDLAKKEGVAESGYRLVWNCNRDAGQAVFHIHLHLLGGRVFHWPPG
ncbi:MAG: histidine triad nucleotide-binding protein [Calditrichaeota bacterium]|nr:MAG: histidine triad nucleotide-binding protein [Calditrichota bacterium]